MLKSKNWINFYGEQTCKLNSPKYSYINYKKQIAQIFYNFKAASSGSNEKIQNIWTKNDNSAKKGSYDYSE